MRDKIEILKRIAFEIEKIFGKEKRRKSDPLDILIATILSQNTNDINSHRAFKNLKEEFPDYRMLLNVDIRRIKSAIKVGGLAKQKARRIKNLLKNLSEKFNSFDLGFLAKMETGDALKILTSFKGVGLKTASCVLLFAFDKAIFPVDTHIHRILNRVGLVKTKTPEQTFHAVKNLIPAELTFTLHTGLIKFGRSICKAREPLCGVCPIFDMCKFESKTLYKRKAEGKVKESDRFILLNKLN